MDQRELSDIPDGTLVAFDESRLVKIPDIREAPDAEAYQKAWNESTEALGRMLGKSVRVVPEEPEPDVVIEGK